jgi:hypothetical protein
LLANPASTKAELEILLRESLAANEREVAYDIRDAIEERFTSHASGRGPKETIAFFRGTRKRFDTAKEAYVWLVEHFVASQPEIFENVRWETTGRVALGRRRASDGRVARNYFARSASALFRQSPSLAKDPNNYVVLQSGWCANTNLSNADKFDILARFGWVLGLKCGADWDWQPLEPSDGLKELWERIAFSEQLSAELEAFSRET